LEEEEPDGEDIKGVEYDRQEETEDQETSQDRDMMDDSTQDPIDPLIAYAQMNAEMEEDGSEDELANRVIKRRLLEGRAGQAAPPRRKSYQLEASKESEPETPQRQRGLRSQRRLAESPQWTCLNWSSATLLPRRIKKMTMRCWSTSGTSAGSIG
jgi:hypothetical protein